uniref:Uncharacterized protein n=1 Tax=Romanomermis culicivorax TaxID=13658 RepID=A0A915HQK4_ROMCU
MRLYVDRIEILILKQHVNHVTLTTLPSWYALSLPQVLSEFNNSVLGIGPKPTPETGASENVKFNTDCIDLEIEDFSATMHSSIVRFSQGYSIQRPTMTIVALSLALKEFMIQ